MKTRNQLTIKGPELVKERKYGNENNTINLNITTKDRKKKRC